MAHSVLTSRVVAAPLVLPKSWKFGPVIRTALGWGTVAPFSFWPPLGLPLLLLVGLLLLELPRDRYCAALAVLAVAVAGPVFRWMLVTLGLVFDVPVAGWLLETV